MERHAGMQEWWFSARDIRQQVVSKTQFPKTWTLVSCRSQCFFSETRLLSIHVTPHVCLWSTTWKPGLEKRFQGDFNQWEWWLFIHQPQISFSTHFMVNTHQRLNLQSWKRCTHFCGPRLSSGVASPGNWWVTRVSIISSAGSRKGKEREDVKGDTKRWVIL